MSLVSLLMVLPLLPAGAAAPDCNPCWTVPLYVQAGGGLSSLVGDSMPSDTSTVSSGSVHGSTEPLAAPLTLSISQAFRIVLPSHSEVNGSINATYRVSAVDLAGREYVLATRHIEAPLVDAVQRADDAINETYQPRAQTVESVRGTINAQLKGTSDQIGARSRAIHDNASNVVLDGANATVCGQPDACRSYHGRPGTGNVDPCSPSEPKAFSGTPQWATWYAVQVVDRRDVFVPSGQPSALSPWRLPNIPLPDPEPDVRICMDRESQARNSTAPFSPVDQAIASLPATNASAGAVPPPPIPAHSPTMAVPDWTDVTLDIDHATPFASDGSMLTLPAGLRLSFVVNATMAQPAPRASGSVTDPTLGSQPVTTPMEFAFGRADALTRMTILTPDRGTYARFAVTAEAIEPGTHTGVFGNATDVDAFSFAASSGKTVTITTGGTSAAYELRDENGAKRALTGAQGDGATWVLIVGRTTASTPDSPYTFHLDVSAPPVASGYHEIQDGDHLGTLAPGHENDTYTFWVAAYQRFELSLGSPAGSRFYFDAPSQIVDPSWSDNGSVLTLDARGGGDGFGGPVHLIVMVKRAYGEGDYSLSLWRDPDSNTSAAPHPSIVWAPNASGKRFLGAMVHDGDGIDIMTTIPGGASELFHVDRSGPTLMREEAWAPTSLARAQDGLILERPAGGVTPGLRIVLDDGIAHPIAPGSGPLAFGADGALYATRLASGGNFTLDRILSGHTDSMVVPADGLVTSPDGSLYAVTADAAFLVDFANASVVKAPSQMAGVEAFDRSGASYRIIGRMFVERYDPTTNRSTIVLNAAPEWIDGIAFAGDDLYVRMGELGDRDTLAVAAIPGGWPGFEPRYDAPLLPDLTPVDARDRASVPDGLTAAPGNEVHVTSITVENQGDAFSAASDVNVFCECGPGTSSASGIVPPIPPHGKATIDVRWNVPLFAIGDHALLIGVDESQSLFEANESNNELDTSTFVLVGGDDAICQDATHTIDPPPPDVGTVCGADRLL